VKYRTIVADPPWKQPSGGPANGNGFAVAGGRPSTLPYGTMTVEQIAAYPTWTHAAADAHLWLWTTNAHIEHAYEVARSWRFRPSVLLTWAKEPRGIGLGGAFTQTTEHVLFARRGSLAAKRRLNTTWFQWPRGAHSAKPEAFLDLVESVSPGPYLELFARRQRLGWDTWGNEALEHVELATARDGLGREAES
jgi:N6-adenosine-specific RNA methylase IME4